LAWFKGRRPLALFLQSPHEPGELWQCSNYDETTVNVVQLVLLLFFALSTI